MQISQAANFITHFCRFYLEFQEEPLLEIKVLSAISYMSFKKNDLVLFSPNHSMYKTYV